jgi:transposase
MRSIKEVLRLHQEIGLSSRQIAKSCDIARSTVKEYLHRARRAGVSWPLPPDLKKRRGHWFKYNLSPISSI